MPSYGISLSDSGFEVALDHPELRLVAPEHGGGPLGWMGLAHHDGQKFFFGRPAEGVWFVHPRQICHHFWSRLSREASTVSVEGRPPSFSQLAFFFLRDLQEKIVTAGPMDKLVLAVPGAYLKDAATEDERVGLLLGMAAELKLPLVGIVDMAVAALCDARVDYFDPALPVIVVAAEPPPAFVAAAFRGGAADVLDLEGLDQARLLAHHIRALPEDVPHMLPGVAVFLGCRMKACFGHNDREDDSCQQNAHRADSDRDCGVVRTEQ